MHHRNCRICNTEFSTRKAAQTLCSWKCRAASKVTRVTLKCRECGSEYTREPNQVRKGRRYFCSRECGFKHGKPFEKKFWAKVDKNGPVHPVLLTRCWLWTGSLSNKGYGVTRFERRAALAHIVSYRIHKGEIAQGMEVMHRCDTPACLNPAHLKLGTHADNMADCVSKKRNAFGARQGGAKFTDEKVNEAKRLRAEGATYLELEKHFGICRQAISDAVRGKTWKHLTP